PGTGATAMQEIVYAPEKPLFVAVGNSGALQTSPDGKTWTSRTSGTTNTIFAVAWSPSQSIFVLGDTAGLVRSSPDGITWTSRTTPFGGSEICEEIIWVEQLSLF